MISPLLFLVNLDDDWSEVAVKLLVSSNENPKKDTETFNRLANENNQKKYEKLEAIEHEIFELTNKTVLLSGSIIGLSATLFGTHAFQTDDLVISNLKMSWLLLGGSVAFGTLLITIRALLQRHLVTSTWRSEQLDALKNLGVPDKDAEDTIGRFDKIARIEDRARSWVVVVALLVPVIFLLAGLYFLGRSFL